ncbi:MAG: phosphomannomutase [Acidobacteriota bacterium]|nr:phosphomannomutase [Acidobacteriota bacterium]
MLRSFLNYEPQELRFGTSGRRGLVIDLTQLEIYINVVAELGYLQSLPTSQGGIAAGQEVFFAYDLRPSSTSFVPDQQGRGELTQAVVQAITDARMIPVNLGPLPTPALSCYALSRCRASIMVTGSHIPFDRNGYKTNTSQGELLKEHEAPIAEAVAKVRERIYTEPFGKSLFTARGELKRGHSPLPQEHSEGRSAYVDRYTGFFADSTLRGKRIVLYEHSAVGRDILREILQWFDAEVIPAARSSSFVPIDTENIDAAQLDLIQRLTTEAAAAHGPIDAVLSVDGDSDRPLLLGVCPSTGQVHFFGGDLVGMIVASYLNADSVVVPISCNDAIDRGNLAGVLEPKTRIGSPYVIAGMQSASAKGRRAICGWEANGGFLLGCDLERKGRTLKALPTRDAVLPILCTLFAAQEKAVPLTELFAALPKRFSRAALIRDFPRPVSAKLIQSFSSSDPAQDAEIRKKLSKFFPASSGFGCIANVNYLDGVRITFDNGEVVHIRSSGNADELRVYAVADSQARANFIVDLAVQEPGGILRAMEKSVL